MEGRPNGHGASRSSSNITGPVGGFVMSYQNYAGAWLTQSNANYLWLANPWQPVVSTPGVDTAKIWQSFTLPSWSPINNLIVWGDGNYAAGNDQDNVLIAQ